MMKKIKIAIFLTSSIFLFLCRHSIESLIMVFIGAGMIVLIMNQYNFSDKYYSSWLGKTFYSLDTEKARAQGFYLDLIFWGLFMCAGVFHAIKNGS